MRKLSTRRKTETRTRFLLVANPTAQSGKNAERIAVARDLLRGFGISTDLLTTLPEGGTVERVAQRLRAGRCQIVVSMGGDGTFAEVAKGLLASGRADTVALGMLPTGTANDQGKSFGLSAAPEALSDNVAVLAAGARAPLDVGRIRALDETGGVVREDFFFDSAGWGISPRILKARNEDRRVVETIPVLRDVYRDHAVYAGALLRTFLESYVDNEKFDVQLRCDAIDVRWSGLIDLVVKGTRFYGGGWVLDRASEPDDGLFEVVPFQGRRDWLSKGILYADNSPLEPDALAAIGIRPERLRARHIDLTFEAPPGGVPLAAQIDGEEFIATDHVRIDVQARALTLVVPQAYSRAR